MATEAFQVLAIDGGGARGMFSAAVLAHIEEDLNTKVTDHFDLIVGTSTGGIIALALGLGFSPREVLKFYVDNVHEIFPSSWWPDWVAGLFAPRYSTDPLTSALQRYFGDRLLGHSAKRLVIPAFNLDEMKVQLFKTAHHERFKRDHRLQAWKVARATSAAPTFFSAYISDGREALIDGGVWANNPTMVGLAEATGVLGVPMGDLKIFSLGTIDGIPGNRKRTLYEGGRWTWKSDIATVLMAGQAEGASNQALHLLGEERFVRFSPEVPDGTLELDTLDVDALVGKAAHYSRKFMPTFQQRFAGHRATPFQPCHRLEG